MSVPPLQPFLELNFRKLSENNIPPGIKRPRITIISILSGRLHDLGLVSSKGT